MNSLVPATRSLLSRLPAWFPGGLLLMRPADAGGATPMLPKNGRMGISMRSENRATLRCASSGMIFMPRFGKSPEFRTPVVGLNPLYA